MRKLIANLICICVPIRKYRHKIRPVINNMLSIPKWIYERKDILDEHELDIFGIPVLQWGRRILLDGALEKFVRIFHKSLEHQFLDYILSFVPKEHDLIYLYRGAGSGDVALTVYMMKELEKKYKAKNPVAATWSQKVVSVINFINKNIPTYLNSAIPARFWDAALARKKYKYRGKTFVVLFMPRQDACNYMNDVVINNTNQPHYCHYYHGINKSNCVHVPPEISEDDVAQAITQMKILGLENKKFVFVCPEANVVLKIPDWFWKDLVARLQTKGMAVFENTASGDAKYGGKTMKNSIQQSIYIASKSAAIIGTRQGLQELCAYYTTDVPNFIIYTKLGAHMNNSENISVDEFIRIASLKHFPKTPKALFEYNSETMGLNEIADNILDRVAK